MLVALTHVRWPSDTQHATSRRAQVPRNTSSSSSSSSSSRRRCMRLRSQPARPLGMLLPLLLALALAAASCPRAAALQGGTQQQQQSLTQQQPYSTPIVQASIPARYCPNGWGLEGGLCYPRCRQGWYGLACTCWKGMQAYTRGCGVKPSVCQSMSFRRQRLPPVGDAAAFSLVLSADPQLFRVVNKYRQVYRALPYNQHLVASLHRVTELRHWPWEAGGGPVLEPKALVVLGDMTEFYREDEVDAFRQLYDPSVAPADIGGSSSSGGGGGGAAGAAGPGQAAAAVAAAAAADASSTGSSGSSNSSSSSSSLAAQVSLPTWLMFGNHDYVINVNDCAGHFKSTDRNVCARTAVDTMRAVLTPGCDATTWSNFPRENVTSFDANSLAYSFDYGAWHFVVLQYSPRHEESSLSIRTSLGWLAQELSAATAQQRRIVLLLHAHRELGLALDPTFSRLLSNSNVVALFYGHVHIKPWGMTGNFPNTNVPMFNCGASWYHVHCYAEFGANTLRVAAVVHNATGGDPTPQWFGSSVHALLRQQRTKPVLQQFSANPNQTWTNAGSRARARPAAALLAGLPLAVAAAFVLLAAL